MTKRKTDSSTPVSFDEDEEEEGKKEFNKILVFLRKNVPSKTGQIKKEKVTYVTGSKLVDTLMSSQWGSNSNGSDTPCFDSRTKAIQYCKRLLDRGYLIGGKKIEMKVDKKTEEDNDASDSKDGKKKMRRFRIEWLSVKDIKDSPEEIYIWQYEVPQRYTIIIGLVLLLGVVGFTLQPLWPESSKMGMWFLSVIMMVLLGLLLGLYIVRWFLYALIVTLTCGKVVFWLLPNLDDDKLGIIDSFKPLYSIKRKKKKKSTSTEKNTETTVTSESTSVDSKHIKKGKNKEKD